MLDPLQLKRERDWCYRVRVGVSWNTTESRRVEDFIANFKTFQITRRGNPEEKKKKKKKIVELNKYKRGRKCLKTSVSVGTQIAENPN